MSSFDKMRMVLCSHCGEVFVHNDGFDAKHSAARNHCLDKHPEAFSTVVFTDVTDSPAALGGQNG